MQPPQRNTVYLAVPLTSTYTLLEEKEAYGNKKVSQAATNTVWTTLILKIQMELKEKYIKTISSN